MLKDVPLKEFMVTKVISVQSDEPFSYVEEKLRVNKIRHLPVVDEYNKLVGIITERDLYHAISPRRTQEGDDYYDESQLDSFILKEHMTPNPIALRSNSTFSEAVKIMATLKYGCIPIVSRDGILVGIITQIDILKFLNRWLNPPN